MTDNQNLDKTVYGLWFEQKREGKSDIELLIGIYETEADARAVIQRLKEKPGFVSFPAGFKIYPYPIGRTEWQEGFSEPD